MTTSQVTTATAPCSPVRPARGRPSPSRSPSCRHRADPDGRITPASDHPPADSLAVPRQLPGRPITPSRLGRPPRTLGIYALAGRRATLLDLAAQLPAAVLADLLHLAPTTAVRWMHQAGGDWTRYAAELARTGHHQP